MRNKYFKCLTNAQFANQKNLKINLKPENDSNYLNNSNILFCENCFIFKDVTNNKFYADKKNLL